MENVEPGQSPRRDKSGFKEASMPRINRRSRVSNCDVVRRAVLEEHEPIFVSSASQLTEEFARLHPVTRYIFMQ